MSFVNHFTNSITTNATTITVNVSGVQANDTAILCFYGGGSSSAPSFPSGFNAIGSLANQNVSTADGTCTSAIKLKTCAGGESSFTVTWTGSNLATLVCHIYRGRNASAPVTASAQTTTGASTLTGMSFAASITGVTAAAGDDIAVFVPYQQTPNTTETLTFTAPTGYGNTNTDYAAAVGNSPGVGSCNKTNVSAGATGTLSATLGDNQGASTGWISYVVSLAAAPVVAVVQSTTAVGSGNSVTATLTGVTAANTVVAVLSYYENGATNNTVAPTPTDTNGTFSVAAAPTPAFMVAAGIGSVGTAVWYVPNAAAGTHAVTQTNASGPTYELHLTLLELSGLGTTPAIAAAANVFVSSGALAPVPLILPSGIMNQPAAFIVGLSAVASSTGVANAGMTTPSGFTNLNTGSNTSTDIAYEHGYQVPSVGGPFQAQWAWSDNTTSGAQAMLVGFGSSGIASSNTGTPLGSLPALEVHYR